MSRNKAGASLFGGALAAAAASACCLGPSVLVSLGVGGAWIANVTALEPYRPAFTGLAAVLLALAYRQVYRPSSAQACEPESFCASPPTRRLYKILFWAVSAFVLAAIVFPFIVPYFY